MEVSNCKTVLPSLTSKHYDIHIVLQHIWLSPSIPTDILTHYTKEKQASKQINRNHSGSKALTFSGNFCEKHVPLLG